MAMKAAGIQNWTMTMPYATLKSEQWSIHGKKFNGADTKHYRDYKAVKEQSLPTEVFFLPNLCTDSMMAVQVRRLTILEN